MALALALHGAALALAVLLLEPGGTRVAIAPPAGPFVPVVLREAPARKPARAGVDTASGAPAHEPLHRPQRRRAREQVRPNVPAIVIEAPAPHVYVADGAPVVPSAPEVVIAAAAPGTWEVQGEGELGDSSRRPLRHAPGAGPGAPAWLAFDLLGVGPAHAPVPSEYCVPRAPAMPDEARLRGVTGRVVARYDVGPDGIVKDFAFADGPDPLLAGAVGAWLRGCLFDPAVLNGRRVPGRVQQTFDFVIR